MIQTVVISEAQISAINVLSCTNYIGNNQFNHYLHSNQVLNGNGFHQIPSASAFNY